MSKLRNKTIFISGASRGIGLAIAVRAARDGANVALIAKTGEPHPKLEGTAYTAAEAIEQAGGQALPIVGDIRNEQAVAEAVAATVDRFGGIDICINNASAISLANIEDVELKRYDLMQDVNARGTFVVSRSCLPHLKGAENPHILTVSPPISLDPKWLAPFPTYTISKYGMTLLALGLAHHLRPLRIASNTLWPRTVVATDAVRNLFGGEERMKRSRTPALFADAAYEVLTRPSDKCTANTFLTEDVLEEAGVTDFSRYNVDGPDAEIDADLYVDSPDPVG